MSDTPSSRDALTERLRRHAIVYGLERRAKTTEAGLRAENTTGLVGDYNEAGHQKRAITLPGYGEVCQAILSIPGRIATVKDRAKLLVFAREHAPDEVATHYTFKVPAGFGAADVVTAIDAALAEQGAMVVGLVKEERVSDVFEKLLEKGIDPVRNVATWTDKATGEVLDVPGVEVTRPAPSKFSLSQWQDDVMDRFLADLFAQAGSLGAAFTGQIEAAATSEASPDPKVIVVDAAGDVK